MGEAVVKTRAKYPHPSSTLTMNITTFFVAIAAIIATASASAGPRVQLYAKIETDSTDKYRYLDFFSAGASGAANNQTLLYFQTDGTATNAKGGVLNAVGTNIADVLALVKPFEEHGLSTAGKSKVTPQDTLINVLPAFVDAIMNAAKGS